MFEILTTVTAVMGSILVLVEFAKLSLKICRHLIKALRNWWKNHLKDM